MVTTIITVGSMLVIIIAVAVAVIIAVAVTVIIAVTIIIAVAIIRAGHKLGAAASIHPDAAPAITPRPPLNTGRAAALTRQADAIARISGAIIESPIVRSAIYIVAALGGRVG
jgi:uncharacterized membrane protein